MPYFESSRLKIKWANQHILDVQRLVSALPDLYEATVEINPVAGNPVIKHDLRDRTERMNKLALLIGDAVHNLKCALDYAWIETLSLRAPSLLTDFSKFPIYPDGDSLKGALVGREIDTTFGALYKLLISEIQPYSGANDAIYALHYLNIRDKHKLLTPIVEFAAIEGIELENERGEVEKIGTWASSQKPPYYVPIETGWHIKNKGHVVVEILFEEGTPLYDLEIIDTLQLYSRSTLQVIECLETIL